MMSNLAKLIDYPSWLKHCLCIKPLALASATAAIAFMGVVTSASDAQAALINGSFETPDLGNSSADIITLGNNIRFAYSAVSTGSGNRSVGNFLDAADFGVGVGIVPEPLTMLGAATAIGFGASFKRKLAKKKQDKANKA
ncbi:PEP-CTERM sorting domain-containing protein [Aphanothece sacrum]|nr:quinoprotein [Aphanothece sacrum FPU3]